MEVMVPAIDVCVGLRTVHVLAAMVQSVELVQTLRRTVALMARGAVRGPAAASPYLPPVATTPADDTAAAQGSPVTENGDAVGGGSAAAAAAGHARSTTPQSSPSSGVAHPPPRRPLPITLHVATVRFILTSSRPSDVAGSVLDPFGGDADSGDKILAWCRGDVSSTVRGSVGASSGRDVFAVPVEKCDAVDTVLTLQGVAVAAQLAPSATEVSVGVQHIRVTETSTSVVHSLRGIHQVFASEGDARSHDSDICSGAVVLSLGTSRSNELILAELGDMSLDALQPQWSGSPTAGGAAAAGARARRDSDSSANSEHSQRALFVSARQAIGAEGADARLHVVVRLAQVAVTARLQFVHMLSAYTARLSSAFDVEKRRTAIISHDLVLRLLPPAPRRSAVVAMPSAAAPRVVEPSVADNAATAAVPVARKTSRSRLVAPIYDDSDSDASANAEPLSDVDAAGGDALQRNGDAHGVAVGVVSASDAAAGGSDSEVDAGRPGHHNGTPDGDAPRVRRRTGEAPDAAALGSTAALNRAVQFDAYWRRKVMAALRSRAATQTWFSAVRDAMWNCEGDAHKDEQHPPIAVEVLCMRRRVVPCPSLSLTRGGCVVASGVR
jgi:hypothetical protein